MSEKKESTELTVADGLADFRSKTNDSDLIYRGEVRRILQDQKVVHKERAVNRLTAAKSCPVVRGEWVVTAKYADKRTIKCSVCGDLFNVDYIRRQYNFCPNCGADLRGE